MKNKILISLCAVLAICCIVLSFCLASIKGESESDTSKASGTLPAQAAATSSDIQFKLSLLHLYYESQQLVSTLPYATVQITYAALIKAFMTDSSAVSAAVEYLNKYLKTVFDSLKNSSVELISRTRSLILVSHSSNYDSSYTLYNEQLADLTSKIQSAVVNITNEYEALLAEISSDYDMIK